jgi:phosphatidylserine/phosphatidylglycerophosphate/cardiolipin synthase-like enzyme
MHCKYVIRDGAKRYHTAAVWTGSTNFTDDAWTRQENNIITVTSETVAPAYLRDFTAMWDTGTITNTGTGDTGTTSVGHAQVGWDFAPGDGPAIDTTLTNAITTARDRIEIAAMVLTSHPMLAALAAAHQRGIPVTGIYDAGQMDPIESEWAASSKPATQAVLVNWRTIKTLLAAKHSTPYTPTGPHDFMHNKILITDTSLFTGSYNFSANAEHNAENQLHVSHDQTVLAAYTHYLATITSTYQAAQ